MYFQMSLKWSLVATICGQYIARPHIYDNNVLNKIFQIKIQVYITTILYTVLSTVKCTGIYNDYTVHCIM